MLISLTAVRHEHPVVFLLALVGTLVCALCAAVLEYFKPTGKRRARNGTRPRMPPGPRGLPLLGMLTMLSSKDTNTLKREVCLSLRFSLMHQLPFC